MDVIRKGLEGVIAAESKICFIDGDNGRLLYRGYNINDLAKYSTFEEVSYLLLFGRLPNGRELKEFNDKLVRERNLPRKLLRIMKLFPKTSNIIDNLRTVVSLLGSYDRNPEDNTFEKNLERGISLIAKLPTIVSSLYRINNNLKIIRPNPKISHAANFLYMLRGRLPNEIEIKAMDLALIIHTEHGFNASTFSARVTISTLSDIYSAIVSAIGTLKGPLHGGASKEAFNMLKEIGSVENVENYVREKLSKKEKIFGFGHRVYKVLDPRVLPLKEMSNELAKKTGNFTYLKICERLEEVVVPLLKDKKVFPNVDLYSGVLYNYLGIPEELFDCIFAVGRIVGWVSHILEQLSDNRLIRPIGKYVGKMDLEYVPIDKRR
jgi:citrate synthase